MGSGLNGTAMLQVARVLRDGTLAGMSDRQILERFVESRDEIAFEAIVSRHGPMVRRVCQQMLFNPHDVDDAVQAVFLVLVRKARFIRTESSLGPWLYTVAGRVAARARANRRKRWARESSEGKLTEPSYCSTADAFELSGIIHDELGRLPERLRAPLVLCYLEGLTHDLAARQLDCPVGTVRSRLARGRHLLHRRILRRGLTLSTAALGGILEANARAAACAHLPASLARSVTGLAIETLGNNGMGLTTSLGLVMEGVLSVLPIKKVALLAAAISAGTVAFAVVERTTAGQTPESKSQATPSGGGASPRDESRDRISVLYRLETEKNPSVLAIEAKLKEKVSVQFDVTTLGEAVKYLQDRSRLNIVLDPKALSEEGVTVLTPVSLTAHEVPLKSVLKLLLKPLGLTYKIEDEVVLITSPQADQSTREVNRKTYYIGDLIMKVDDMIVPAGGKPAAVTVRPKPDVSTVINLIEVSVAPGTWKVPDEKGGLVSTKIKSRRPVMADEIGSIIPFYLSVSLIIECPDDVHEDLANFFRNLRALINSRDAVHVEELEGRGKDLPDKTASNGEREAKKTDRPEAAGAPNVDVLVNGATRILSPQKTTTFQIQVANVGIKEATNLRLTAQLSPNLEFQGLVNIPQGIGVSTNEKRDAIKFDQIDKLAPGKSMAFGIRVKAVGEKPGPATCKAIVTGDGLTEGLEDMACVKVMSRRP